MPFHSAHWFGKLPTWYPPSPRSHGSAISFACEITGSWWMMSKNEPSRSTSFSSRASAEARSKRKPSMCISWIQYRRLSMMSCSVRGCVMFNVLPHPVKSM